MLLQMCKSGMAVERKETRTYLSHHRLDKDHEAVYVPVAATIVTECKFQESKSPSHLCAVCCNADLVQHVRPGSSDWGFTDAFQSAQKHRVVSLFFPSPCSKQPRSSFLGNLHHPKIRDNKFAPLAFMRRDLAFL